MTSEFDTEISATMMALRKPANVRVARGAGRLFARVIAVTARITITGNNQNAEDAAEAGGQLPGDRSKVVYWRG